MKNIIYSQTQKSEIIKIYFSFIVISLLAICNMTVSIISGERSSVLYTVPFVGMLAFMYFFFRDFIKYGADIEINSEHFIVNNKTFEFSSLIEVGQCTNRHLVYFIFSENDKTYKFVGFNRFTHKEMLILNDKTEFIEMIKRLGGMTDKPNHDE